MGGAANDDWGRDDWLSRVEMMFDDDDSIDSSRMSTTDEDHKSTSESMSLSEVIRMVSSWCAEVAATANGLLRTDGI